MAEHLEISEGSKEEKYALLLRQIECLVDNEKDPVALMANASSMIHFTFNFFWTGFYRVMGDELVLGPFQGPLACSRIKYGKGVCGRAWKEGHTLIVDDVNQFPGHIACSSDSKSEIVVPVRYNGQVVAVIDIDSEYLSCFDHIDAVWLERIAAVLCFK